jgi:hypothetical protein
LQANRQVRQGRYADRQDRPSKKKGSAGWQASRAGQARRH